ncbi:MAG: class I SAM-dependent methyltransferase [bacterium]|nr:class I SAM-dependent methyltransferase [bacterium]
MNILHLALGYDPAGVGQLLCNTINEDTKHTCKFILPTGSIMTEMDKQLNRFNLFQISTGEIQRMIKEADVIHMHQLHPWQKDEIGTAANRCSMQWNKILADKPWILHNHGGEFLINPPKFMKFIEHYNPRLLICSPLSEIVIPKSTWLPNLVPLDEPLYKPIVRQWNRKMEICHKIWFPSTGMYKGTKVLEEVCKLLKDNGYNLNFKVYHGLNIEECLKQTAKCHVCIDNLTQGFIGMSGWESMAKGQVVIARLDPLVKKAYTLLGEGEPPPIIHVTGMDELGKVLRELNNDREKLKEWCDKSREWMEKYYNPKKVTQMYMDFYEETIRIHKRGEVPVEPVVEKPKEKAKAEPKSNDKIKQIQKEFGVVGPRYNFEKLPHEDEEVRLNGLMGSSMLNTYEIDKVDEFFKEVGLIHNRVFLDCGCGVGRLTPTILKSHPKEYIGIDFSGSMVKEFSKNFPDLKSYQQDLADLNKFKDNSVDTAFIMYIFIHILDEKKGVLHGKPVIREKLKEAIEELKRVSRQYIIVGHDMTIPEEWQSRISPDICRFVPKEMLEKLFHPWKVKYWFPKYYQLYSPYDDDLDSATSFIVFENPEGVAPLPDEFRR